MPGRTEGEIRQIVAGFVRAAYYSETAYGFLGEPIGGGRYSFTSARLGYVKARLIQNDQVTAIIDVLNTKAPLDPRIRLIIGKNRSGEWEVVEVDATYIAQFLDGKPGMGTGPHSHRLGYGLEDYLEPRRFEPGLVRVYDQTMTVYVLPYSYLNSVGDPVYFAGDTLDLTTYRPLTTGQWCWAKVGLDATTGDLMVETGAAVASADLLTAAGLYAIPFTGIPLAGVKLKAGMSAIDEEIYFMDCRVWYGGGGGSSGGEANTGANVGTGAGFFRDKIGVDLNFKTLKAGSNKITVTGSADEVTVDVGTISYSDISGTLPAHTHSAADVTSGTLDVARIPDITAAKIDSGAASNGHVLTADGVGGSAWQAVAGGSSVDYVRLSHTLPEGTNGGTATSGSWQVRPINTEDSDASNICSLASNEFTLAAGTYDIFASAIFYLAPSQTRMRLYNVTDAATVSLSLNARLQAASGGNDIVESVIRDRFTISSSKTLRLEYRVALSVSTTGLGQAMSFGVPEIYALIELRRVAV